MSKEPEEDNLPGKTIWQHLDLFNKPWYIWLPALLVLMSLLEALFGLAGINEWIAWVASTLILVIIFTVVGILAQEDALERGTYERDYSKESEDKGKRDISGDRPLRDTHAGIFDEDIKRGYVLVSFWASWYKNHRKMEQALSEINQEIEDVAIISLYTETEENQKIASAYGVESLPTLILFRDGEEIDRFTGQAPAKKLLPKIEKHLA